MDVSFELRGCIIRPLCCTHTWHPDSASSSSSSEGESSSSSSSRYLQPQSPEEAVALRDWLHTLPDGAILPVRGRDRVAGEYHDAELGESEGAHASDPPPPLADVFTPWEYGVVLKHARRLFLLWEAVVESYLIDGCDYIDQLHFHEDQRQGAPPATAPTAPRAVVVLSHGFSDEVGPNYALVQCLAGFLRANGYRVIVPDYRPSYGFGSARSRSERVRILLEEILACVSASDWHRGGESGMFLIGHSQGGAASAQLCASEKVVKSANIRGLLMLGSECPTEVLPTRLQQHASMMMVSVEELAGERGDPETPLVVHEQRPAALAPHQICIVHSSRDRVISSIQAEQLGERWGCRYVELADVVEPDYPGAGYSDDIDHDFLARDMLRSVVDVVLREALRCSEDIASAVSLRTQVAP